MKIALIIPYFNAEPWLERCLKSIGSQPFNVILVNDHSEDDGPMIATEGCMSSEDWHHLEAYDKTGVSYARNIGIKKALELGADYITFLDADDELAPGAYFKIQAAICEEPDEPIIQLNHYRENRTVRFFNPRGTYWLDKLPLLFVLVWNKAFKADLFKTDDVERFAAIEFIEGLNHGEDELFIFECLKIARRIYCSEQIAVIHHTDNPNSLSRQTSFYDLIDEQDALLQFLLENAPYYPEEDEMYNLCEAVRQRQADLWTNAVYRRVIGGRP